MSMRHSKCYEFANSCKFGTLRVRSCSIRSNHFLSVTYSLSYIRVVEAQARKKFNEKFHVTFIEEGDYIIRLESMFWHITIRSFHDSDQRWLFVLWLWWFSQYISLLQDTVDTSHMSILILNGRLMGCLNLWREMFSIGSFPWWRDFSGVRQMETWIGGGL